MPPQFSIVIPTRNRPGLIEGAIRSALSQTRSDFELLISDNSTNDETQAVLKTFDDPRIRIIRPAHSMLMHDHWQFAMDHASGEFITFLCDDDALHPRLLDIVARVIDSTGADVVTWRRCEYCFEDMPDMARRCHFRFVAHTDNMFEIDGTDAIDAAYEMRITNNDTVPRMLNCMIPRDLVRRAEDAQTPLFRPMAPDYSAMLAMFLHATRIVLVDAPLGVFGQSIQSTGTSGMFLGEVADTFMNELLEQQANRICLPKIIGVHTCMAETYMQCAREYPLLNGRKVNLGHVYGGTAQEIEQWRRAGYDVAALERDLENVVDNALGSERHVFDEFISNNRNLETERFLKPMNDGGNVLGFGPFLAQGANADDCGFSTIDSFAAGINKWIEQNGLSLRDFWDRSLESAGERAVVLYGLGHYGRTLTRVPPPPSHPLRNQVYVLDDGKDETPNGFRRMTSIDALNPREHFVIRTPFQSSAMDEKLLARGFDLNKNWKPLMDIASKDGNRSSESHAISHSIA